MQDHKIELLAPAGSFDSLTAAVQSGADAIYIGGKFFSARASAANFNNSEIEEAVLYCKKHNVKLYVTVNILIKNSELKEAADFLSFLHEVGVDGVIIQDLGLWLLVEKLEGLERHVSTQMTLHNSPSVELLVHSGAERIVLSRELSLEEVSKIKQNTDAKLEIFGHGALCFCYSGQCLMSSMIGARSGNRGRCAQPCRLTYELIDNIGKSYNTDGDYLLSTKDLRTGLDLDELAGIADSLKLEGRLKKPEYVATITSTYRKLLDNAIDKNEAETTLREVFNRDFTKGYLLGDRGKKLMGHRRPGSRGLLVGQVLKQEGASISVKLTQPLSKGDGIEIWQKGSESNHRGTVVGEIKLNGKKVDSAGPGDYVTVPLRGKVQVGSSVYKTKDKETEALAKTLYKSDRVFKKQPVTFFVKAKIGSEFVLKVQDLTGNEGVGLSGYILEKAKKRALDLETLSQQLDRLGNTPYSLDKLEADLDQEVMVPFSIINETRRKALEDLEEKIASEIRRKKTKITLPKPEIVPKKSVNKLIVEVASVKLLEKALSQKPDMIYLSGESFQGYGFNKDSYLKARELCRENNIPCYYVFPRILHDRELSREKKLIETVDFDGYVVGNMGVFSILETGSKVVLDWGLNVTNYLAFDFYKRYVSNLEIERCTLSLELKNTELKELAEMVPAEVVVHGNIPVMVSENCIIGTTLKEGVCSACSGFCRVEKGAKQYFLKDRLGYEFPIVSDTSGRSHIFNSRNLCLIDATFNIKKFASTRLMFFLNDEPVGEAIEAYKNAVELEDIQNIKKEIEKRSPRSFTYGHYFRGVE